jgi:hypothetical protein
LEAKQNKGKNIFRKGKTCEFSQCIITLEAKQNKEKKIHFAKGNTFEFSPHSNPPIFKNVVKMERNKADI